MYNFQGRVSFPTGGVSKRISPQALLARFGEIPKPTVKSG